MGHEGSTLWPPCLPPCRCTLYSSHRHPELPPPHQISYQVAGMVYVPGTYSPIRRNLWMRKPRLRETQLFIPLIQLKAQVSDSEPRVLDVQAQPLGYLSSCWTAYSSWARYAFFKLLYICINHHLPEVPFKISHPDNASRPSECSSSLQFSVFPPLCFHGTLCWPESWTAVTLLHIKDSLLPPLPHCKCLKVGNYIIFISIFLLLTVQHRIWHKKDNE